MTTLDRMTDLDLVALHARWVREATTGIELASLHRDKYIRACYAAGNGTLKELAEATGLTKQRISQIVLDGRE
jgi:hypothetical protein